MARILAPMLALALAVPAVAQDTVRFRDRGKPLPIEEKGKIDSESIAGINIKGRTIPSADILDVIYEPPGAVRLEQFRVIALENQNAFDEAIKGYAALAANPAMSAAKPVKRHYEFKVALLTAWTGDDGTEANEAGRAALAKFIQEHPDGWQRVAASRLLAELALERRPPDVAAAVKIYDDLAKAKDAPAELKRDCAVWGVDALLRAGRMAEAKNRLASLPAGDPRSAAYQIACAATPETVEATAEKLKELLGRTEEPGKGVVYNLLGTVYAMDANRRKDALFAHLWVDVVYHHDPREVTKAQLRIAELFRAMNQEERAKSYRDKARGR